jgi:hypothetical protein
MENVNKNEGNMIMDGGNRNVARLFCKKCG